MTLFEARFDLGNYIIDWARLGFARFVSFEALFCFVEPQGLGIFVGTRIQTFNETQSETSPIFLGQPLDLFFQGSVAGTHADTILLRERNVND